VAPLLQTHLILFVVREFQQYIVHCTSITLLIVIPILTPAPYWVCSV